MRSQELEFIRQLVQEQSGMLLSPDKDYLVESRLEPLLKEQRLADLSDLVSKLRGGGPIRKQVVEAMLVNETSFFRDKRPFDVLGASLMPELLKARAKERRITVWCAACSTGQEPYSVAMVIKGLLPAGWSVRIVATDLSEYALNRGRSGVYTLLEVNRGLPADMLARWFDRDDAKWKVKEELRQLVQWRNVNLLQRWPHMSPFDVVFMRNVLIYFDPDTNREILRQLRQRALRPDGYLFLGAGETTFNLDTTFTRSPFGAGCYRLESQP